MHDYRMLLRKLTRGFGLEESSPYALEVDWCQTGAQELPFGVVKVDNATIEDVLDESNVVFLGGPAGSRLVCFLTR